MSYNMFALTIIVFIPIIRFKLKGGMMKKLSFSVILIMCMVIAVFAHNDPEGLFNETTPQLLPPPQYIWGNDILITNNQIGGLDFATDYSSGSIYAYQSTRNGGTADTCFLFKSTDNGLSWTDLGVIQVNGNGDLSDPEVIVTDGGRIAFLHLNIETDGERRIRLREFNDTTLTSSHWEYPTETSDTVLDYDFDYADGYYYITYSISNGANIDIYGVTCHEDSSTWSNNTLLYTNATIGEEPRVSAGIGGTGYVAFIENRNHTDTLNIRCKRTYDYGASWEGSVGITDLTGQDISDIDIACDKSHPGVVWITTQYNDFGNWGYYLSTDSCDHSSYVGIVSVHSGWDEYLGTVESHPLSGWATFAFRSDSSSSHNVAFFYNNWDNPSSEQELQEINQHNATDTYRPEAGNILHNSAVIYAGWGPTDLYFDSYINNTGINDNITNNSFNAYASPAMFHDNTEIFFTLSDNSNASIDIFNALGQRVWSYSSYFSKGINSVKWSGNNSRGSDVPEGVYFFRVNNGSSISSGKMTLF